MSLYGNVKKIGSASFQFDRVYSNRKAMDTAATTDGVYAGRYVLVEYGERYKNTSPRNSITYINQINTYIENAKQTYYAQIQNLTKLQENLGTISTANRFTTSIIYNLLITTFPNIFEDYFEDAISNQKAVKINVIDEFKELFESKLMGKIGEINNNFSNFYQNMIGPPSYQDVFTNAIIEENSDYRNNSFTDLTFYGATYDSTVWQKTYVQEGNNTVDKYIMIAELNARSPQLDIKEEYPVTYNIDNNSDNNSGVMAGKINENTGELEVVKLINAKEKYNEAYFDSVVDTEQRILMHYPQLLELEAGDNTVNYNEHGFNAAYSYNIDDGQSTMALLPVGLEDYEILQEFNQYGDLVNKVDTQGNILARLNTPTNVKKKRLYANFPAIGNTMKILYDLIYGFPDGTDEELKKGVLRPYFRKFIRTIDFTNYLTVINNNNEEEYVTLQTKNSNETPAKIPITSPIEVQNSNGVWEPAVITKIFTWAELYNKNISPDFIVAKYKTIDGNIIDLPNTDPADGGYAFLSDSRNFDVTEIKWTMHVPSGDEDGDSSWQDEIPGLKEILKNNTAGLANILMDLFNETNPLTGEVKYYLYNDWAAENNDGETNTPVILNKPYTVGGYPTTFVTYPNEELSDLSGGFFVNELGRAIAVNKRKLNYSYTDTKISSDFTDGHYNIDFNTWQLLNTEDTEVDLTNLLNIKVDKIIDVNENEELAYNHDIITITQEERTVRIYGNINQMHTVTIDGVQGNFIGLDIRTGIKDIKALKINGISLTAEDEQKALDYNLRNGHIAYLVNINDILTETVLRFSANGYDDTVITLKFVNVSTASDFNVLDISVNKLISNNISNLGIENQNLINIEYANDEDDTLIFYANIETLNTYDLQDLEYEHLGQWIGIDINTHLDSIVGITINNIELTQEDENQVTALGLPHGHIVIWEKPEDLLLKKSYIISAPEYSQYVLIIQFKDIRTISINVSKVLEVINDSNKSQSQQNQNLINISKFNTDFIVYGDLNRLNSFELLNSQEGTGKWIALDIATNLPSIEDVTINNYTLTTADVEKATAFGLPAGHILFWMKAENYLNDSFLTIDAPKYRTFECMIKFINTTVNMNEMNVVVNKVNIADNESIENNQNATLLVQSDNNIYLYSNLDLLDTFNLFNDETKSGKWVGLDINTGVDSILLLSVNNKDLTEDDEAYANSLNLPAGHFIYWVDILNLTDSITLTLRANDYYDKEINIFFKPNILDININRLNNISNNQIGQRNQNVITVIKDENEENHFTVLGDLQLINPYVLDNTDNIAHKWIGLSIDTKLDSIIGVLFNNIELTEEDEHKATNLSLPNGYIVLWYDVEDLFFPQTLTIKAYGYQEATITLDFSNTNSEQLDMDIVVEKLINAPNDLNNIMSQENQDLITITQNDNNIVISGPLDELNTFNSTNPSQGEGKWIGIDINTHFNSIVGATWNSYILTQEDEDEATTVDLGKGHIIYWAKAESLLVNKQIIIGRINYNDTILNIIFLNTSEE